LKAPVSQLIRSIDYQFSDPSHLQLALTHRSVGGSSNERLEFLGDAILGFVIADLLYEKFPAANEGQLSRMRANLVKKESLARIARELELGRYLLLGAGESRSGGHSRDSILADAFEAVLAAIYQDGGYPAARSVITSLFRQRIASLPADAQEKDPKTRLQEYLQSRKQPIPSYSVEAITGEQHNQRFVVVCQVQTPPMTTEGEGHSRRRAEQAAAARMLQQLMKA